MFRPNKDRKRHSARQSSFSDTEKRASSVSQSSRQRYLVFRRSCFLFLGFWSLLATKLQKYYIIFVYILQGKMGKMEKKGKKITQLKWPKYQNTKKPKDGKMGWTKQIATFPILFSILGCRGQSRLQGFFFSNPHM